MATGENTVPTRSARIEDAQEGGPSNSLDGSFGRGALRLVGHGRPPFSQQMSARRPEQQNDMKPTSATRAPEVGGKSTEKVCKHVANPCYRDMILEDAIARKSCPLQWDPSVEMGQFLTKPKTLQKCGFGR